MENSETILIAVALAVAGASLYRKYIKKNQQEMPGKKKTTTSHFGSIDNDYEPYSGK